MKKSFFLPLGFLSVLILLAGCTTPTKKPLVQATPTPATVAETPFDMSNVPPPPTPPPLTPENIAGFENLPPEVQEQLLEGIENQGGDDTAIPPPPPPPSGFGTQEATPIVTTDGDIESSTAPLDNE